MGSQQTPAGITRKVWPCHRGGARHQRGTTARKRCGTATLVGVPHDQTLPLDGSEVGQPLGVSTTEDQPKDPTALWGQGATPTPSLASRPFAQGSAQSVAPPQQQHLAE